MGHFPSMHEAFDRFPNTTKKREDKKIFCYRVSGWEDENILEMEVGDDCTTM